MRSMVAFAIAATGFALPAELQGYTMSVPITYNPSANPNLQAEIAKLRLKYGSPDARQGGNEMGTVVTTNEPKENSYITEVEIGNPPQKLLLDFDTGSSDLWVYSNDTIPEIASGHVLYLPGSSSTAEKIEGEKWGIKYADNSTGGGIVYKDVVTVGGLTVHEQGVQSAVNLTSSLSGSGILGLANDEGNTARPTKQKTWFSNIKGLLKEPLFTVRLRHKADGSFNFGYIDESQFTGDITYTSAHTDSEGRRLFNVEGYAFGDEAITSDAFTATPDTGSSLFLLPDDVAKAYWKNVNSTSKQIDNTLIFAFPCNETINLPDLTIQVSGQKVTVPGSFVRFAELEEGYCEGGIAGGDAFLPGVSIFGDVFLKAIFTIFDDGNNRIGFATGI